MDPIDLGKAAAAEGGVVQGASRPPTLRGFLQHTRRTVPDWTGKHPYPSQATIARRVGLTLSYYGKLETGERNPPTQTVLEGLAEAFDLDPVRRQFMFRLAGMDSEPDPRDPEELRLGMDPVVLEMVGRLDDHYVAVFDTRWNLLLSNENHQSAFPGLVEVGNIMLWYFGPTPSREVLVEWEREAELNVYWFRFLMGPGDMPWVMEMLSRLSRNPRFREYWSHEGQVVAGRPAEGSAMHMRDLETGELWTLRVSQLRVGNPTGEYIIFIGHREEYSGPSLPDC